MCHKNMNAFQTSIRMKYYITINETFTSLKSCEDRKCTETLFSFLGTDGKRLSKTNNVVWIPGDGICTAKGESSE